MVKFPRRQVLPFSSINPKDKYAAPTPKTADELVDDLFRGYHVNEASHKKRNRCTRKLFSCFHRLWSISFLLPFILVVQILITSSVVFTITYVNSLNTAETLSLQLMNQTNDVVYNQLNELMQTPFNILEILTIEASNNHIFVTNHTSVGNFTTEKYRESELYSLSLLHIYTSAALIYWSNDYGDIIGFEHDAGAYKTWRKWSYGNVIPIDDPLTTSLSDFCILSGGAQNLMIYPTDAEGNIIPGDVQENCGWDARIRAWYQIAKETPGITRISEPYIFGDGTIGFTFSKAVFSGDDSEFLGVVASDFKLDNLNSFLEEVKVGKTGSTYIMTKFGKFFASNNPDSLTMFGVALDTYIDIADAVDVPDPMVSESAREILERYGSFFNIFTGPMAYTGASVHWESTINGESSYVFVSNFNYGENADWLIVVILPKNDFLSNIYSANIITISMTSVFVLLAIIVAFVITCIIIYPLHSLGKRMKKVSNMQLDSRKPLLPALHEVHQIQTSFTNMVKALKFFKKFIPSSIIQRVMVEDETSVTQIKEVESMTLVFIDIVNFSSFSELLKPSDLLSLMSTALEIMSRIIIQNQGVIDSYIGDAIFALFGVQGVNDDPYHAAHAAMAALECHSKMRELDEVWKEYGVSPLRIRVGINSGACLVGCFGSREKMTFSCLGDVVNLASRLEALCSGYGVGSLISSDTYKEIKHEFCCRALDIVIVKGRKSHTVIYTIEARRDEATQDQIRAEKISREMLKYMRIGDGEETRRYIDSIMELKTYENDVAMKLLKSRTYGENFGVTKYQTKTFNTGAGNNSSNVASDSQSTVATETQSSLVATETSSESSNSISPDTGH